MQIDSKKVLKYNQQYKNWLKIFGSDCYAYDNNLCCCFAHIISNKAQEDGFSAYKVCALASKREEESKYCVSSFLKDSNGEFRELGWDYHIAAAIEVPIYQDSEKTEILVADPVLFGDNLVTLKQWQNVLAVPDYGFQMAPKDSSIMHSPTGFWLHQTEPSNKDVYSNSQISNLKENISKKSLEKYSPLTSILIRSASISLKENKYNKEYLKKAR